VATIDTLELLTGNKSVAEMSDDELREHLRQIRQIRITPRAKTGATKAGTKQSKSRTTKSPFDALLRTMSEEDLQEMIKLMAEMEAPDEQESSPT
jgi:ribosomal protein L29